MKTCQDLNTSLASIPRSKPSAFALACASARAEAQAKANADGFDRGIEANDVFKSWHVFMLTGKASRYGHEVRCEVVSAEDVSKCQPGHGPLATRPHDRTAS